MADAKILKLTAAASRRRSFAASQKKGNQGITPAQTDTPGASTPGPVQGLTALGKPNGPVQGLTALGNPNGPVQGHTAPGKPNGYVQYALQLTHVARTNGAPRLASAIRSVASTPHPADKHEVAENYLNSLPPQVAQQHAAMFTDKLMAGNAGH